MRLTSLRSKLTFFVGGICLLVVSACVFVLSVLREETRQINEVMLSNADVTKAVQEALFSLNITSDAVQRTLFTEEDEVADVDDQRTEFEPAVPTFKLFINALTWGTESESFRKVDGGRVYERWKRDGLDRDINIQNPSAEVRSAAGSADLYYDGVIKYFDQVLAAHGKYRSLVFAGGGPEASDVYQLMLRSMRQAQRYEELTRQSLLRLLAILNEEANARRLAILDLQNEKIKNFTLVFAALFFAVGILAWVFSTFVFIKPMRRLMEYTRVVAGGMFNVQVQVKSRDEMGELAVSLNTMTEKLKDSYDFLEVKVSERTKDLETSQSRGQTILDTANDAFVGMDSNGLIIDWNRQAAATFGWSREESMGKVLAELIIPRQYREGHAKGLQKFLSTGEGPVLNKRVELTALRHDGLEFPVEITIWPVRAGENVQFNAFIRDITDKKKLENQLLQSQKMETVGTLAGGIAHDLNNQLTPVKGYIDLILAQTPPGDPNCALLMEANMSVERCAEVVHRLMGFSRSSNQKKTALSIAGLFKELKGLLKNFLPSTIRVEVVCPEDIHPIQGNETELQTVFMNLATNARDAMPEGGRLIFEIKNIHLGDGTQQPGLHQGDYVLVSVSDTGQGIPPDVIKRIFEPFFTTKTKGQGTGLGLAMVFKIVQDVGGLIDVSSQLGKGTTFHVYLPGKPGEPLPEARKKSDVDLGELVGKHEMILFADDEETIRKMGKVMLEKLGYRVWLCSDGQEAVSVFRDNRSSIHALILDMTMPNLTGKQTMQKVLEIDPKAKIILASGYTVEGSVQELLKLGAVDFLQKPYTIIPLAKSLRAALNPGR